MMSLLSLFMTRHPGFKQERQVVRLIILRAYGKPAAASWFSMWFTKHGMLTDVPEDIEYISWRHHRLDAPGQGSLHRVTGVWFGQRGHVIVQTGRQSFIVELKGGGPTDRSIAKVWDAFAYHEGVSPLVVSIHPLADEDYMTETEV